jgi:membrane protein
MPTKAGRNAIAATSPWQMPAAAWKQIFARTWQRTWIDNVGLVAAGVAFYGFLAFVPLLGLIVIAYGALADMQTVVANLQTLTNILPPEVALLVGDQLLAAVSTSGALNPAGILAALGLGLYGGASSASSIMIALNIAYHETEKRSLLRFYATALIITCGGVIVGLSALAATAAIASLDRLLPEATDATIMLSKLGAYVAILLAAAAIATILYRYAPSREEPRWRWITPGSLFTATAWLTLTLVFGFYLSNVTSYKETYGALGAVIAFLTWIYFSAYVLVIGAELNSEVEHQTTVDSTTGTPQPIGKRGAWAADEIVARGTVTEQVAEIGPGPSLGDAGPPPPTQDDPPAD